MIEARPSRTALRVAMRRAAHQLYDNPKVLDDPIAMPIVGPRAAEKLRAERPGAFGKFGLGLRAFMAARSRFAEDALARSITRGATQYVILGAGLDTFAYRNPYAESALHVFEVDFPATQEWKRRNLKEAQIAIPSVGHVRAGEFRKPDALRRAAPRGIRFDQADIFLMARRYDVLDR